MKTIFLIKLNWTIVFRSAFVLGVLTALFVFSGCARNNREVVANGYSLSRPGLNEKIDHKSDPVIALIHRSNKLK